MVPSSWIHTTFEKHIDCLTGYAFKSSNYSDSSSDIKLLRGDNIEPGSLRWRDAKYWSINQLDGLERYQLNKGDFVIALDRTWISSGLKVAEVRSEDLPCLLVQRVIRVRAKKTLEQGLLRQYFSGHKFEQYVKSVQTATAVPHISPNDIKEFPLLLPPLAEQQKIAQILSTWDQAISTTEKLLENSQQQKKALMQQLLTGKKRLLDERGNLFQSKFKSSALKELFSINKGQQLNRDTLSSQGNYAVINGGIEPSGYTDVYNVESNTITISEGGNSCGYVGFQELPFWCGGHCYALSNYRLHIGFTYQLLKFNERQIMRLRVGSGLPNIQKKDLECLMISYPNCAFEQAKIAEVLSIADQCIETLQKKLDSLKQEKKALMQQLLTGKKRVKVAA